MRQWRSYLAETGTTETGTTEKTLVHVYSRKHREARVAANEPLTEQPLLMRAAGASGPEMIQ